MIYKNIIVLLTGLLLTITTIISGQDTLKVTSIKKDTLKLTDDSSVVKKNCSNMKVEQKQINNEMKKQLDFLRHILDEEEKKEGVENE